MSANTQRIDLAATALRTADKAGSLVQTHDDSGAAAMASVAQVHATLALVEQQRIANLIVISGWVADATKEDVGYTLDALKVGVAGEVWEGLGL